MTSAGKFDDAIKICRIARRLDPLNPNSAMQRMMGIDGMVQRWEEATEFGYKWVSAKPDDAIRWLVLAPTLVLESEPSKYETHCKAMLERFEDATVPRDVEKICKACCLVPDVVDATRLPVEPLAIALETETVDPVFVPWGWSTHALVALRSGRPEKALESVLNSEQSGPSPHAHVLNLAVSALAKVELGETGGALADFGKGSRGFAPLQANPQSVSLHDLLIASIILREAKDSFDRLLPEGLHSFTGKLPEMDPRDRLELLVQFEVWEEAAPLACQISEKLPNGNWKSERALFLEPIVANEPLFNAMLESSSNASDIWLARARRLALRSEWQAAADAFVHSAELRPLEQDAWFEAACAMQILGNEDEYRELISTLLEQMGEDPKPHDGFVFARTIGLASQEKQSCQTGGPIGAGSRRRGETPPQGACVGSSSVPRRRLPTSPTHTRNFDEHALGDWPKSSRACFGVFSTAATSRRTEVVDRCKGLPPRQTGRINQWYCERPPNRLARPERTDRRSRKNRCHDS